MSLPLDPPASGERPHVGIGQGDPNAWPWLLGGFEVVKQAHLDAVKVHVSGDLEVDYRIVDTLYGLGVEFVMGRLFYSGAPTSSDQFIDGMINSLSNLYKKGVRWFEVHNEPNLLAEWTGTPEEWAAFMREVIQKLRPVAPGALWLYPGLSPGPADASVRRAYSEDEFFNRSYPLVKDLCGGICIHKYFTSVDDAIAKAAEANAYARLKGVPVIISEFSNPLKGVPFDAKASEYVAFLDKLVGVKAAIGYVLSSTNPIFEWEVWQGTSIPAAIGQYMEGRS